MGPSKPTVSDATFAFTTQLYRNEAKALQTQLQFNRNVPAVPENLALRFSNPRPIIIEKLKAPNDQRNLAGSEDPSIRSSGMFSVVSEERLKLAIHLAKRDIKQRHLEEQVKQQAFGDAANKPFLAPKSQQQKTEVFESPEEKNALSQKPQTHMKYQQKVSQPSRVETTTSGSRVYVYTPSEGKLMPAVLDSPPTHDTRLDKKPNVSKQEDKNMQQVRRLQKELRSYVQKIEELAKKGRDREILDPDKEQRACTRRKEQAARSARMLYVLQQQVKEIHGDLEKLSPHKTKHTKKSRAVSRLAAAHRGAIRALQAFASHCRDQTEQQIPTHYKELGSLIRQLSLCSAKLEGDSSISDIIIDILLQVEDLESRLEKKQAPQKVKKCISASQSKSPRNTETFPARKQLTSPKRENKPLIFKGQHGQEPRKPPAAKNLLTDKHWHVANISAVQKVNGCAKFQEENDPLIPERRAALQGSTDALVKARAVKKDPILESSPLKKKCVLLPAKSQGMQKSLKPSWVQPQGKHARFQDTTIASQLKTNKRLVKGSRIPRVPPNPTSPVVSLKRYVHSLVEPAVLGRALTECRIDTHSTALRRSQSASPTQCVDKVEKAVQACLEPLLDKTQVAENADILSEKLLDDLLEDTAQKLWSMEHRERRQTEALPVADSQSLESMLQRMEEIERYQEAVCRRLTQIVYSDPEFWAQEDKMEQQVTSIDKRPASPHPIQITRLIGHTEPEMDVLFEKPFDGNDPDENKEAEEKLQTGTDILQTQNSLQKEFYVSLSVPKHMLQSILDYNNRYEHHLKLISHEAVGSFNPWQISESLAEQLTEEALSEVAAELQDVCEDYAEAVFTSEFLQAQ